MNPPSTSPYLHYQPYNDASQYIIPNAEPGHTRGRFELAFSQIGGSVLIGALVGGVLGATRGLRLREDSIKVKRTLVLNSIIKASTKSANTLGLVALGYSIVAVCLEQANILKK